MDFLPARNHCTYIDGKIMERVPITQWVARTAFYFSIILCREREPELPPRNWLLTGPQSPQWHVSPSPPPHLIQLNCNPSLPLRYYLNSIWQYPNLQKFHVTISFPFKYPFHLTISLPLQKFHLTTFHKTISIPFFNIYRHSFLEFHLNISFP
jgi:hypothetical protein